MQRQTPTGGGRAVETSRAARSRTVRRLSVKIREIEIMLLRHTKKKSLI